MTDVAETVSFAGAASPPQRKIDELHIYAKVGNLEGVMQIVKNSPEAHVDSRDDHGFTPMMWAAWHGHTKIVQVLLENGAEIGACDEDGQGALYHAVWQGELDVVELLVERGVDVNAVDNDGETPLMAGAHHAYWSIVQVLLRAGADASIRDKIGKTASDYALNENHTHLADLLQRTEAFKEAREQAKAYSEARPSALKMHGGAGAATSKKDSVLRQLEIDGHVQRMKMHYSKLAEQARELTLQRAAMRAVSGSEGAESSPGASAEDPTEGESPPTAPNTLPERHVVDNIRWAEVGSDSSEEEEESDDDDEEDKEGGGVYHTYDTPSDDEASPPQKIPHTEGGYPYGFQPASLDGSPLPFHRTGSVESSSPGVVQVEAEEEEVVVPMEMNWVLSGDDVLVKPSRTIKSPPLPDDLQEAQPERCPPPSLDPLTLDGAATTVSINIWKRRGTQELNVDTVCQEEEPPPADKRTSFDDDLKRFLKSFPPIPEACTLCSAATETASLSLCIECDEALCEECWKAEHQNKKRRDHQPRPVPGHEQRFEAVAQVAVQLSRALAEAEHHRDVALGEVAHYQGVQSVLLHDMHTERLKRARLEELLYRREEYERRQASALANERRTNEIRERQYQKHVEELTAKMADQKQQLMMKENELQRVMHLSSSELNETRRLYSLREAEYKLQLQTTAMRAQRAASAVEALRADVVRLRNEGDRVRDDNTRLRHKLDVERMRGLRYEQENRRLSQQLSEQYRHSFSRHSSTSSSYSCNGGSSQRSASMDSSASSAPPARPTKEMIRAALNTLRKEGIEECSDDVVNQLVNNLSAITTHEAWYVVGLQPGSRGSQDKAKKLMTRLHPDRVVVAACKESLRKRFQLVNHARTLLPSE